VIFRTDHFEGLVFSRSRHLSPAESLKSVLASIRAPITALRTCGGALCTGVDGPRPGAGRSVTWRRARVPFLTSRAVRAWRPDALRVHRDGGVRRRRLKLAPGMDPVGEERLYASSRIGRQA
jgi:hypothetical protein